MIRSEKVMFFTVLATKMIKFGVLFVKKNSMIMILKFFIAWKSRWNLKKIVFKRFDIVFLKWFRGVNFELKSWFIEVCSVFLYENGLGN